MPVPLKCRGRRWPVPFLIAILALLAGLPCAAVELREDLWVTDGPVHAIAVDEEQGLLYIGGEFTHVGPAGAAPTVARPFLAALDLDTGEATAWDPAADGPVRTMWLSPDGGTLYIGGDFTAVGGQFRNRLAGLSTQTGLTTAWNPGANGTVRVMIPSASRASLFVGGSFSIVRGATRHGVAEILVPGAGLLSGLGQDPVLEPGADIHALALGDDRLYIGGEFTLVPEDEEDEAALPRRLAAIDLATFAAEDWLPGIDDGLVLALHHIPGQSVVYAGGTFSSVESQPRSGIASFDTADGEALAWDPQVDGAVRAIRSSLDRTVLYIGGGFNALAGVAQPHLAAVGVFTATMLDDWRIEVDASVLALALLEREPRPPNVTAEYTLFAGGAFQVVGGAARPYLAALSALPPERQPPVTTANPPGGAFNSTNASPITLVCDDSNGSGCAATYYTTDGSEPDEDSLRYSGPIAVSAGLMIRFFSIDNVGNREAPRAETYEFEIDPPTTTAFPPSRVFEGRSLEITLSCTDSGSGCAETFYTVDGSTPDTSSTLYTGPFTITGTTVVRFFSTDVAGNREGIRRAEYVQNRGSAGALGGFEALIGLVALAVLVGRGRRRRTG